MIRALVVHDPATTAQLRGFEVDVLLLGVSWLRGAQEDEGLESQGAARDEASLIVVDVKEQLAHLDR